MTTGHRVLIVDDEPSIVELVRFTLEKEGFQCDVASDGPKALEMVERTKPDLVVLDLMLPGLDGLEVCRRIRQRASVPIVMLTAKASEVDKVVGLELGADDYVTKPFSPRELVARIRAVLRRFQAAREASQQADAGGELRVGEVIMDVARHQVWVKGRPVELTPKEYDLLRMLMSNKGIVLTRELLLDKVWGYDFAGDTRTVDVHVVRLRQKLEDDPAHPRYIETVRGVGYRMREHPA
ncbi:response regulator transcription factor [Geochorda subterranea]|uniref:Response regulator transcription factor n=1 Tax=Geochorda subterranea TaxID=3109564 RepID=A0ABZ1BRD3_9FIRM|nr:response regulator transcription factor [Limnochorda sp. LNt]WRP15372.1 response regulator transcription factor [Limnochorda sp. LNt]